MATRRVGLLLAAGRGRRFDATGERNKLLQLIDGQPVAQRACTALASGCDAVIAVVGPHAPDALKQALQHAGAQMVTCTDADLGMGHSLATAARAAQAMAPDMVLVMPADMPWVSTASVKAVAAGWEACAPHQRGACIVTPMTPNGQRGHPVAFGAHHLDALTRLSGDEGARHLLRAHRSTEVLLSDTGILRDVDAPSDLPSS